MEPWHDRGVFIPLLAVRDCSELVKLDEHFVSEKNFCPWRQQQRVEHRTYCFMRTVEVTIPNRPRQYACHVHNSRRDPMLLKGQRRQIMEGQMGGSPKAFRQHLAGETSLLESNLGCPGPSDMMRDKAGTLKPALSMSPFHAGVTVAAAPSSRAVPLSATKHRPLIVASKKTSVQLRERGRHAHHAPWGKRGRI